MEDDGILIGLADNEVEAIMAQTAGLRRFDFQAFYNAALESGGVPKRIAETMGVSRSLVNYWFTKAPILKGIVKDAKAYIGEIIEDHRIQGAKQGNREDMNKLDKDWGRYPHSNLYGVAYTEYARNNKRSQAMQVVNWSEMKEEEMKEAIKTHYGRRITGSDQDE